VFNLVSDVIFIFLGFVLQQSSQKESDANILIPQSKQLMSHNLCFGDLLRELFIVAAQLFEQK